jgi:selenocysteine lyase/cysteine desulfurase
LALDIQIRAISHPFTKLMETFSLFRQRCRTKEIQVVIDAISKYYQINANIHRGVHFSKHTDAYEISRGNSEPHQ